MISVNDAKWMPPTLIIYLRVSCQPILEALTVSFQVLNLFIYLFNLQF